DYLHENEIAPTTKVINLIYESSDAIEGFLTDRQHSDLTSLEALFSQYKEVLDNLIVVEPITISSPISLEIEPIAITKAIKKESSFQQDIMMEAFIAEAQEYWQAILQNIPRLANQPNNKELLQEVRRPVHTLKGAASLVKFDTISELTRYMEELLDKIYQSNIVVSQEIINLLFVSADIIEDLLDSREKNNLTILEGLLAQYKKWLSSFIGETVKQAFPLTKRQEDPLTIARLVKEQEFLTQAPVFFNNEIEKKQLTIERRKSEKRETASGFVRVPIERLDEVIKLVGELVINRSSFEQYFDNLIHESDELGFSINRLRRVSTKLESDYDVVALGGKLLPSRFSHSNQPFFLPSNFTSATTSSAYEFDELEFDRYTEFNVSLKELVETTTDMNTVNGELRNTIGDFDSYLNRLGRLTREVQDKLMQLRLIPLANLASRLHRTVRTTASQQQKQVDLVIEGEHIEVDKTVLEEIVDPLFHLLRNAVDHGIEPPALRQALGKSEKGEIKLQAYYEGTQVVIRITDNGSGINTSLVRSIAVNRGYASETEAAKMTDEELFSFIFMPGFSTAKEVSEISGRGVGMDIVKAKVQKMKGTITIASAVGQGTAFTIRLPMTLAITLKLVKIILLFHWE
ncbi:MAG: CheA signal transduction histidine kinase, partial [bacterium]